MDKKYLKELDTVYEQRMEEINQGIVDQVQEEYGHELDQMRSANSQAAFWNSMGNRYVNHRQAEINNENTQNANQNRETNLEQRIHNEINRRSEEQARIAGAEIFEDFGGSREAAFEHLNQYEEEQKAQIKNKAKWELNVASGIQAKRQEQIKSKAYWGFDIASGAQQQKREAIQGQAKDAFQEVGYLEELDQEQIQKKEIDEKAEVSVEIKTLDQEQSSASLDTAYWKTVEQSNAQIDTPNLITTTPEQSYDAKMAARITRSFSRSESKDRSL